MRAAIGVLIVIAGLWVIYQLEKILLLILLAVFFAYLISPLVHIVQRPFSMRGRKRCIPRAPAIGIVYLFIFLCIGVILYVVVPLVSAQISQLLAQSPTYIATVEGSGAAFDDALPSLRIAPKRQ